LTANRRIVLLVCLLLCGWTVSFARAAEPVIARGQGNEFWLLRPMVARDKSEYTSVRRLADPVAGTWAEANRIGGRVIDAAALGDRLAVLPVDGGWRLIWSGGSVSGPVPPQGRTLRRLASSNDVLWAIATVDAGPAELLRWTEEGGWRTVTPLPAEADLATASLDVIGESASLAWVKDRQALVAKWRPDSGWQPVASVAADVKTAKLIGGAPYPLVAVRPDREGQPTDAMAVLRVDEPAGTAASPPKSVPASDLADVTVVGPGVRIVDVNNDKLNQTTIDDYGRGAAHGPDPLPEPAPTVAPRQFEWINVLIMTALTVIMLRNLRTDPENPPLLASGLRLAPMWRRVPAALIDLLPCVVTTAWVFTRFDGTTEEFRNAPERVYLPIYLGLMAYLVHVTIGEIWLGKSIGKWLFGLRVVGINAEPVTPGRIVLRNVLRSVELTLLLPALLPFMSPLRQRLGDMAARTTVVTDAPAVEGEQLTTTK
jgi:uncharacterized RDD family membrane protein YckC